MFLATYVFALYFTLELKKTPSLPLFALIFRKSAQSKLELSPLWCHKSVAHRRILSDHNVRELHFSHELNYEWHFILKNWQPLQTSRPATHLTLGTRSSCSPGLSGAALLLTWIWKCLQPQRKASVYSKWREKKKGQTLVICIECTLTLGQGVNSHAKLPEVGMFHGLLGRNPLLGFILRWGRQGKRQWLCDFGM